MADDAVQIGPVSVPNSLIIGKIQGISSIPALFLHSCAQTASEFNDLRLNSLRNGTGNFLERTGNLIEGIRENAALNRNASCGPHSPPFTLQYARFLSIARWVRLAKARNALSRSAGGTIWFNIGGPEDCQPDGFITSARSLSVSFCVTDVDFGFDRVETGTPEKRTSNVLPPLVRCRLWRNRNIHFVAIRTIASSASMPACGKTVLMTSSPFASKTSTIQFDQFGRERGDERFISLRAAALASVRTDVMSEYSLPFSSL